MSRTFTKKELDVVLEQHRLWLVDKGEGARANFSGANLSGANFSGANFSGANFSGANISGANFYGSDLSGSDLSGANFYGANFYGANLGDANLHGTNLGDANFSGANLYGANISGANFYGTNFYGTNLGDANLGDAKDALVAQRSIVPVEGSFVAFKKVEHGVILKLLIPDDARRLGGVIGRKCRASKAVVLEAIGSNESTFVSRHDQHFTYTVGKSVEVGDFCDDPMQECAPGIHFFMSQIEAEEY